MDQNLPTLQPRLILGFNQNVSGSAQFVTDEDILYPVGAVVAMHNINEKKQKYIRLSDRGKNLTHICVSPNKRFIALAEAPQGKLPYITLWDPLILKRKRSIQLPTDKEITTTSFVAITFTFDSKLIIGVTGDPDWQMYCFKTETGKLYSSARANNLNGTGIVYQIACNPNDVNLCCIIGDSLLRIMAFENNWKQIGWNKADITVFTSCCWLSQDRLLAGTSSGRIYVFEHAELKTIFLPTDEYSIDMKAIEEAQGSQTSLAIPNFAEIQESENYEIRELLNLSKGFAFGFNSGKVYFFEKETPTKFKRRNVYSVPDYTIKRDTDENVQWSQKNLISCISTNPSQDRLMVVTDQQQIYSVKLWQQDPTETMQEYGYLLHNGPIGGISVCRWKSIVLTSGATDRTLRLWNYETEEMELMQRFEDDIFSVSLHPTGLYACVGFSDRLRYFNIMIDDFMLVKEFSVRFCRLVRFSKMGHLFAAANANVIQIFSSIFFTCLYALKGHIGRIQDVSWAVDDHILATCGNEGSAYEWDVQKALRVNEYIIKSNPWTGIAMTANGKSAYAVGHDGRLRELSMSNIQREVILCHGKIDAVVLSQLEMMLFTSAGGVIHSVKIPLLDKAETLEYVMHQELIPHMAISFDDRFLITASLDGSLCFWKINSPEGKSIKMDQDFKVSKEILISKHILEEKLTKIKELGLRLKELETEHAYQMRQSDAIHAMKLRDVHTAYCGAIEDLKEKNDKMESGHTKVLNKIHEEIAVMEVKHEQFVKQLEASYNEKLIAEYDKYVALEERLNRIRNDYKKELDDLAQAKTDSENAITTEFLQKIKDMKIQYEELHELNETQEKDHETIKQQIEDDADMEIYELKTKHNQELKEERDLNVRLKGEASQAKKKLLASQKEVEDTRHSLIGLENELKKFKNQVMILERDIQDLKKEIGERDSTIEEKEKRIFQLKSKNQELEKFKFILDFKIKELKSQIEPRERTIMEQSEQISEMVAELEKLQKVILNLDLRISDMREKLTATTNECAREVAKNRKMQDALKRMRVDIHNCSGLIQNIPLLIKTVKDMYHKYNPDVNFTVSQAEDTEVKNEFMRQREFLERTATKLQKQAIKSTSILSSDKVRLVGENVQLLHEANDLRKNLKIELKTNYKMKSLLGLSKYLLPSQAQKKMEMATATREEIHDKYKQKLEEMNISMNVLKEEKSRLLNKLTCEDTKVIIEEKPIQVYKE